MRLQEKENISRTLNVSHFESQTSFLQPYPERKRTTRGGLPTWKAGKKDIEVWRPRSGHTKRNS